MIPAPDGFALVADVASMLWRGFDDDYSRPPSWSSLSVIDFHAPHYEREKDAALDVEFALCELVSSGLFAWRPNGGEPSLMAQDMFVRDTYPITQLFDAVTSVLRARVPRGVGRLSESQGYSSDSFHRSMLTFHRKFNGHIGLFAQSNVDEFFSSGSVKGVKMRVDERRFGYFAHMRDEKIADLTHKEVHRILVDIHQQNIGLETAKKFLPKLKRHRGILTS